MVLRRPARLATLLGLATLCTGCAVGYSFVRPSAGPPAEGDGADWSAQAFAVLGTKEQAFAATRVLRQRHGVLDVRPAPAPAGAFTLAVETKSVAAVNPLALLSFLTFAVVPGWEDERRTWIFMLTAPDGATFDAEGETGATRVSWLPLFLFGPTFTFGLDAGWEYADFERRAAAEEVTARFLASAAAFVKVHGAAQPVAP